MNKRSASFYYSLLAVVSIFLLINGYQLFSDGMFVDGLTYAAVSKNLANGNGSWWSVHYTDYLYNSFYEHPPLVFWLQSLFFRIFGEGFLSERLFSIVMYLSSVFLMAEIWKLLSGSYRMVWLPVLLWSIVPDVGWGYANNMLENVMTLFILASCYYFLLYRKSKKVYQLILAGLLLSLAFLCKGPFCLYLWALPMLYWIVIKQKEIVNAVRDTLIYVLSTVTPVVSLYLLSPGAKLYLTNYIERQVIGSISNVQTVDTRFHIIGEYVENILPSVILCILMLTYAKWKSGSLSISYKGTSKVLALLAICGVVPIMISMKQRGFYIITVYPFFALSLSLMLHNIQLPNISWWRKGVVVLTILAAGLSIFATTQEGRDQTILSDIDQIEKRIGQDNDVGLCPNLWEDWQLHGYMARRSGISLDFKSPADHRYIVVKGMCKDQPFDKQVYKGKVYSLFTK